MKFLGPVEVGIKVHVLSISAVSEVDMDFTLDVYFDQHWLDERLAFEGLDVKLAKFLPLDEDYMNKIWKPDTFFPNEKKSFLHDGKKRRDNGIDLVTTQNNYVRVEPDGKVIFLKLKERTLAAQASQIIGGRNLL